MDFVLQVRWYLDTNCEQAFLLRMSKVRHIHNVGLTSNNLATVDVVYGVPLNLGLDQTTLLGQLICTSWCEAIYWSTPATTPGNAYGKTLDPRGLVQIKENVGWSRDEYIFKWLVLIS